MGIFLVPPCLGSLLGRSDGWDDSRTGGWNDLGSSSFTCQAPRWLENQKCQVVWLPHSMLTSELADFLPGGSGLKCKCCRPQVRSCIVFYDGASWVTQTISLGWGVTSHPESKGRRTVPTIWWEEGQRTGGLWHFKRSRAWQSFRPGIGTWLFWIQTTVILSLIQTAN